MNVDVAYCGIRGALNLHDILYQARKSGRIAPVQVVRADVVVGGEHIEAAARLAARSREQGRQQADRPEVEFCRYLAGEAKIQRALAKVGIPETAEAGIAVALGERCEDALEHFVGALGYTRDDTLIVSDEAHLEAFGITAEQQAATTPGRRMDLVLEAVASVDWA